MEERSSLISDGGTTMIMSRRVEDMIYHVYYMYGCKTQTKQMESLKRICMNEINSHEGLREQLNNDSDLRYFVIQMALESVSAT